jgi:DNA-binding CsgD family transcriptional regulator
VQYPLRLIFPLNSTRGALGRASPLPLNTPYGNRYNASEVQAKRLPGLTPRQSQVAILSAEGMNCPAIGHTLGITSRVVRIHRCSTYRRLGIHSTAQLAKWVFAQTTLAYLLHESDGPAFALNTSTAGIQPESPQPTRASTRTSRTAGGK